MQSENVIIIGGGPAGLAAAVYNARANLNPLMFAGSPPGGQLILTSDVENYPGFESILGPELVEKMRSHAKKFGTRIVDENVVKVDFSKKPFEVYLSNVVDPASRQPQLSRLNEAAPIGAPRLEPPTTSPNDKRITSNVFRANAILIATGAKAIWLGLESEERLRGRGVSACATCDGFFFKEKVVGVVGGGDTALEEALTLTKFASKIYIIHRRDSFRASKIMQDRVLKHPKIEVIWNAEVVEVVGEQKVEGVRLVDSREAIADSQDAIAHRPSPIAKQKSTSNIKLDGLFIAIGHKPDTEVFKGQIELDEKGYVVTSVQAALDYAKRSRVILTPSGVEGEGSPAKAASDAANAGFSDKPRDSSGPMAHQNDKNDKQFNFNYQFVTSIPGVFAAGDCVDHVYRQAGTAVGMGIAAALEIEKYLS